MSLLNREADGCNNIPLSPRAEVLFCLLSHKWQRSAIESDLSFLLWESVYFYYWLLLFQSQVFFVLFCF